MTHEIYDLHTAAERAHFFALINDKNGSIGPKWHQFHKFLQRQSPQSRQRIRELFRQLTVTVSCFTAKAKSLSRTPDANVSNSSLHHGPILPSSAKPLHNNLTLQLPTKFNCHLHQEDEVRNFGGSLDECVTLSAKVRTETEAIESRGFDGMILQSMHVMRLEDAERLWEATPSQQRSQTSSAPFLIKWLLSEVARKASPTRCSVKHWRLLKSVIAVRPTVSFPAFVSLLSGFSTAFLEGLKAKESSLLTAIAEVFLACKSYSGFQPAVEKLVMFVSELLESFDASEPCPVSAESLLNLSLEFLSTVQASPRKLFELVSKRLLSRLLRLRQARPALADNVDAVLRSSIFHVENVASFYQLLATEDAARRVAAVEATPAKKKRKVLTPFSIDFFSCVEALEDADAFGSLAALYAMFTRASKVHFSRKSGSLTATKRRQLVADKRAFEFAFFQRLCEPLMRRLRVAEAPDALLEAFAALVGVLAQQNVYSSNDADQKAAMRSNSQQLVQMSYSSPALFNAFHALLDLCHLTLEPDLAAILSLLVDGEGPDLYGAIVQSYADLRQLPTLFEQLLSLPSTASLSVSTDVLSRIPTEHVFTIFELFLSKLPTLSVASCTLFASFIDSIVTSDAIADRLRRSLRRLLDQLSTLFASRSDLDGLLCVFASVRCLHREVEIWTSVPSTDYMVPKSYFSLLNTPLTLLEVAPRCSSPLLLRRCVLERLHELRQPAPQLAAVAVSLEDGTDADAALVIARHASEADLKTLGELALKRALVDVDTSLLTSASFYESARLRTSFIAASVASASLQSLTLLAALPRSFLAGSEGVADAAVALVEQVADCDREQALAVGAALWRATLSSRPRKLVKLLTRAPSAACLRQLDAALREAPPPTADKLFAAALKLTADNASLLDTLLGALVARLQRQHEACVEAFLRPLSSASDAIDVFSPPSYWRSLACKAERLLRTEPHVGVFANTLALHALVRSEFACELDDAAPSAAPLLPRMGEFVNHLAASSVNVSVLNALTSVLPRLEPSVALRKQVLAIVLRRRALGQDVEMRRVCALLDDELLLDVLAELAVADEARVRAALALLEHALASGCGQAQVRDAFRKLMPMLLRRLQALCQQPCLVTPLCAVLVRLVRKSRDLSVNGVKLSSIEHMILCMASSAAPDAAAACIQVMIDLLQFRSTLVHRQIGVFLEISKLLLRSVFAASGTSASLFEQLARFLCCFGETEHEHVMKYLIPVLLIEIVQLLHKHEIEPEKRRAILAGFMPLFQVCERDLRLHVYQCLSNGEKEIYKHLNTEFQSTFLFRGEA